MFGGIVEDGKFATHKHAAVVEAHPHGAPYGSIVLAIGAVGKGGKVAWATKGALDT